MKKLVFFIVGLVVSGVLAGCNPVVPPHWSTSTSVHSKALVYFYRPEHYIASNTDLIVYVDNIRVGQLGNSSFVYTTMTPGRHTITVRFYEHVKQHESVAAILNKTFDAKPGFTYFVRMVPGFIPGRNISSVHSLTLPRNLPASTVNWRFVTQETAIRELKSLHRRQ